jgi:hypothetical protein
MEDTSGFYKWNDNQKEWMYGPNIVGLRVDFCLVRELKDTYEYPVDGWTWYDERPADPETI